LRSIDNEQADQMSKAVVAMEMLSGRVPAGVCLVRGAGSRRCRDPLTSNTRIDSIFSIGLTACSKG
jgi:hypothetical protein